MYDIGLGTWPARRARMSPHRPAFSQGAATLTFAELDRIVDEAAGALAARGVAEGDRVAFLSANAIEHAVALFATARVGAIFLPLNTRLAAPELAWILADAAPRLFLHSHAFDDAAADDAIADLDLPTVGFAPQGGRGLGVIGPPAPVPGVAHQPDAVVMLQYTSGTSGRPKGVMLTHRNITFNAVNLLLDVDVQSDEVSLVTAPLFHTAALNQVLLPTFLKGGRSIIEPRFDPARCLELIEAEGVTLMFGVASMYQALARQPGFHEANLATLRSALSGGAPVPRTLLETWAARGVPLIQGYGLTEASPGTTMLRTDAPGAALGSAGTACFFTDVRIVDASGRPVPAGEAGEVEVRGPNVSPGYWRNAAATAHTIDEDGWLHTGDLARADEEGFVFVVDRVKDMFISGGENVYPAEVEQALYTHPDVAEAAVIGVPHDRWGEAGRAVVVLREGAELTAADLIDHLSGLLARYKIPKDVVFVEALPHNGSGKLMKPVLRESYGATLPPDDARDQS